MAESRWKNLLDQSREGTHRSRRSVEDETGKGDRSALVDAAVIRPVI
jgi:hypothetical protein